MIDVSNLQNQDAIQCTTKEQAIELFEELAASGYRWRGGDSLLNNSNWDTYKTGTCYIIHLDNLRIAYASLPHIESNPKDYRRIILCSDLITDEFEGVDPEIYASMFEG